MGKRTELLKRAEKIVCSECSAGNKTLLHRDGMYICKDCYAKRGTVVEDTPEMKARKDEIRETIVNATIEKQKENATETVESSENNE